MRFSFSKIREYNRQLPLDKQINSEVLFILSFMAVLTGINNLVLKFPVWYSMVFFGASVLGLSLFVINYTKGWYRLSRIILVIVMYGMNIASWLYNGGIDGSALLFIGAIIIFSAGIYGKISWLLVGLNGVLFLVLVSMNHFFPETVLYTYRTEAERVLDLSTSYIIILLSVSLVFKTIFDNYNRASDLIRKQKDELEKLNSAMERTNRELESLNMTKDKLLAIISHDLRSPVNSLVEMTSLLEANLENFDKATVEKSIRAIKNTQVKSSELLEDLLLWAKSQTGVLSFNPSLLNLRKICSEICEEREPQSTLKGITLINNINNETVVFADINMLKTVLRNLVSNAIKFTGNGGSVTISSDFTTEGKIKVSVTDTGTGIHPEILKQIFEFRENYTSTGTSGETGTGLGLLLCREFAERHGGILSASSIAGKGSVFSIAIPAASSDIELNRALLN